MTNEFEYLGLAPNLVQAVSEFGYETPTPIQTEVIPLMLNHQDVIGQAQTGTGKTAAFALPILQNLDPEQQSVQALVLAPTRELALQVSEAFQSYARFSPARVLAVYGGQSYGPQINQLRRGVQVVVGTPGRLMDLMRKGALDLSAVRTLVLDEADEMLSMGFVEDIEQILKDIPEERQTALFSATVPAEIRRLAKQYMHQPQTVSIEPNQVTVAAIQQRYHLINEGDKLAALTRIFEMEEITSALVFVRTRVSSSDLANELARQGYPAEALNGDLAQDARQRTLNRFRNNQLQVLVATDVAARGLDIDDISHVINYDMPEDPEIYVHRIGRTGRAGRTGIAISLVSPREKRRLRQVEGFARTQIERAELPTAQDINAARDQRLVKQVDTWLQRNRCKHEREMIDGLVEQGYDPLEVAAAALKVARQEEKQRPIAEIREVVERDRNRSLRRRDRSYSDDGPRNRRSNGNGRSNAERSKRQAGGRGREYSHEAGMVRLSLNMGRSHGIRPNDIVGAIAFHADIPGSVIGKIFIEDQHTLVDVPENLAAQVLAATGKAKIHKQSLAVVKA
jgi:ATP-dependent RNA helicase DeaD